jgi:hypothetical protein
MPALFRDVLRISAGELWLIGSEPLAGHRKWDIKELFCLCGFAFLGFALWLSFVPVTTMPMDPMVSQAIRVRAIRNTVTQIRQKNYENTGDYAEAVLAVEPQIQRMQHVIHQASDGWTILNNDPEMRRSGPLFQLSMAAMQQQGRILEEEVLVAHMMQQAEPQRRQELLKNALLPLMNEEQISRERLQEYRSRPGI